MGSFFGRLEGLVLTCKQEHGVELRHLNADPIQTECTKIVYLVRTQLDLMKFICSHVHNDASKGLQREYFVYFVPRRAVACEKASFFGLGTVSTLQQYIELSKPIHNVFIC